MKNKSIDIINNRLETAEVQNWRKLLEWSIERQKDENIEKRKNKSCIEKI